MQKTVTRVLLVALALLVLIVVIWFSRRDTKPSPQSTATPRAIIVVDTSPTPFPDPAMIEAQERRMRQLKREEIEQEEKLARELRSRPREPKMPKVNRAAASPSPTIFIRAHSFARAYEGETIYGHRIPAKMFVMMEPGNTEPAGSAIMRVCDDDWSDSPCHVPTSLGRLYVARCLDWSGPTARIDPVDCKRQQEQDEKVGFTSQTLASAKPVRAKPRKPTRRSEPRAVATGLRSAEAQPGRVIGRRLSRYLSTRVNQINRVETTEGVKLIMCSGRVCYFERPMR